MKKQQLIYIYLTIGLILGLVLWLWLKSEPTVTPVDTDTETVDENTPDDENTEEDNTVTEEPDDSKLDDVQENPTVPDSDSVNPFITSALKSGSTLTIRGFVPEIVEDGGDCLFKLKNSAGTVVRQATTKGFVNVAQTDCTPAGINIAGLASGVYRVTLQYSSTVYSGVSETYEVEL